MEESYALVSPYSSTYIGVADTLVIYDQLQETNTCLAIMVP